MTRLTLIYFKSESFARKSGLRLRAPDPPLALSGRGLQPLPAGQTPSGNQVIDSAKPRHETPGANGSLPSP